MHDRLAHAMDLIRLGLLVGPAHQTRYPAHENTPVAEARKCRGPDVSVAMEQSIMRESV